MSIRRDERYGSGEAHMDGGICTEDCVWGRMSLRDGFPGVWKGLQDGVLGLCVSEMDSVEKRSHSWYLSELLCQSLRAAS